METSRERGGVVRVLITGMRAPVALEWARRFAAAGHEVIGADCLACPLGKFSNTLEAYVRLASPVASSEAFAIGLEEVVESRKIDLLVPTCEEIFYVAIHRPRFSCAVFADEIDTLAALHNKWRLARDGATGSVIATPETLRFQNRDDMERFLAKADEADENTTEWVFKPVYSRFACQTLIGPSRWRLEQLAPTETQPWIAQRRIVGSEFCTFTLADRGSIFSHATYRTPYRAGRGAGIYFEPMEHPLALEGVTELVARHQFTGQIGCDFIEDKDANVWMIESNPRATSGLHLLPQDPQIITRLAQVSNPVSVAASPQAPWQSTGSRCSMIAAAMPLWGLIGALQKRRLSFLRDCWQAKDVIASWADWGPMVGLPIAFAELLWLSWKTGKSPSQASTSDIEWNG